MTEKRVFPPFVDVHVHFRDPGVPEAETDESGLTAARRGGFAKVVVMPNTDPAGDNVAWISKNLAKGIWPSACITKGRLGREVCDLEALAAAGAVLFTDDGSFVEDAGVMEEAMRRSAALGITVAQHALEKNDGVIRKCRLASELSLPVVPVEAETRAIERDISICRTTGCRLHIQHISTAKGVELVRNAQREGLPVTAEATPHHLLFSCDELTRDDASFKMAPPLGNNEDRFELRRAVKDGVLFFATDHAPHLESTKSKGFLASANGITGLEAAIPVTYAVMVEEEGMKIEEWARRWWEAPRSILPAQLVLELEKGPVTTVETGIKRRFDESSLAGKSRNSPYIGLEFSCWPV